MFENELLPEYVQLEFDDSLFCGSLLDFEIWRECGCVNNYYKGHCLPLLEICFVQFCLGQNTKNIFLSFLIFLFRFLIFYFD